MKNYIQPGRALTLAAPSEVSSGDIVIVGSIFGIAAGDAATGEPVDIETEGVFTLPKVEADVIETGDDVFTDGDDVGIEDSTHFTKIGVAVEDAGTGATSVAVRLSGHF